MKNLFKITMVFFFALTSVNAQQEKGIIGSTNWLDNWSEFKPSKTEYNDTNQILTGEISTNTTLYKKDTYLLMGRVYVTKNAILTIEPGTVIKGDFETNGVLVITKGAKIIAEGLATDPIVFTSNRPVRKAGDWGGIVILGDAPMNKFGGSSSINFELDPAFTIYGGLNTQANSGILKFLRIEFAGKKIKGFKDYNALTLAGVGNKTQVSNVMCSFSASNSFEMIGGDVVASKVVSLRSNGDDFRFTQGTQCKLDNVLAVRHSLYSSSTRSRCMNVLSYDKLEETDVTKIMSNVSVMNSTLVNSTENLASDLASNLVKEGLFIGNNVSFSLKRSIISGFSPAAILAQDIKLDNATLKKIEIRDTYINSCKGNIFVENSANNEDLEDYYGDISYGIVYEFVGNKDMFLDIYNVKNNPDFRIKLSNITASNSK